MNENGQQQQRTDGRTYLLNRNRIAPEVLAPFAGQQVAFNNEGTAVVAHGESYEDVFAMLMKLGISPSTVVLGYIPALDEDTWL